MRYKEKVVDEKNVIQVFLNPEEAKCDDIKKEIQELQASNKNVVVFLSGVMETATCLKSMLQWQKIYER